MSEAEALDSTDQMQVRQTFQGKNPEHPIREQVEYPQGGGSRSEKRGTVQLTRLWCHTLEFRNYLVLRLLHCTEPNTESEALGFYLIHVQPSQVPLYLVT